MKFTLFNPLYNPMVRAYLALIFAVTVWSTQPVVGVLLMGGGTAYSPLQTTLIRQGLGVLVMVPLFGAVVWRTRHVLLENWRFVLRTTVFGMFGYSTLSLYGLSYTTALNASIMAATVPALTVIVARLFWGQKIPWDVVPYLVLSFAGVLVVITRGDWQALVDLTLNQGDITMFGASVCWAVYTLTARGKPPEINHFTLMTVNLTLGVCIATVVLGATGHLALVQPQIWTPDFTVLILYSALLGGVLSISLYTSAVPTIGTVESSIWLNLVPAIGSIMAMVLLGEKFYMYHAVGGGMIGWAVYRIVLRGVRGG